MSSAQISYDQLSAVAVTVGPGLGLCLQVGVHRAAFISHQFKFVKKNNRNDFWKLIFIPLEFHLFQ